MLFKPELAAKIPTGQKTQTRRLVKDDEYLSVLRGVKAVYGKRGLKWQVGQTYAIQPGRGQKAIGRFRLLDIRQEGVQEGRWGHSHYEGYREGVEPEIPGVSHLQDEAGVFWRQDKLLFSRLWDSINTAPGQRWQDNPKVWVLTFEYVA